MTLFTAEGVLQADDRPERGVGLPPLNLWFAYQLLVEVKVASELAKYTCSDEVARWQDEMYRWAWTKLPGPQATVRAVGTLTRGGGSTAIEAAELRAADVTWSQVRDLIQRLLDRSAFGARGIGGGSLLPEGDQGAHRRGRPEAG